MENAIATVDAYIAAQERPEVQDRMRAIRAVILENAPEAQEKISWGMATYMLHGTLIHFAAQKHHIGLYPGVEAVVAFLPRLEGYKTSKGAIQLPLSKPLPLDLVRDIVMYCVQANTKAAEEKTAAKTTKTQAPKADK